MTSPATRTVLSHIVRSPSLGTLLAIVALMAFPDSAMAQLVKVSTTLPGVERSAAEWGDYDNDGDLDLALAGKDSSGATLARIYRNDTGTFVDIVAGLPGVEQSCVAWGDYDRDGDLDLVLAGLDGTSTPIARLYRNDAGVFADALAGLPGVSGCSLAWADFDNDGDLDLAFTGLDATNQPLSRLYQNTAGVFSDANAPLAQVSHSSVAWGDYNADGTPDLVLTGRLAGGGAFATIYRNEAGILVDSNILLANVQDSSVAWMDMDSDGDLDLALMGRNANATSLRYRNDGGGSFQPTSLPMPALSSGGLAWGDYDADGDPDLVLSGLDDSSQAITLLCRNDGSFSYLLEAVSPDSLAEGCVAWGDYDNDGKLDLLITGTNGTTPKTHLFQNQSPTANTPPSPPNSSPGLTFNGSVATFSWTLASDGQTPSGALTYNLRVGTSPTGGDIVPGMADSSSGYRRVTRLGNTVRVFSRSIPVGALPPTTWWSVQALDASFAGSTFSTPQQLDYSTSQVVLGSSPNPSLGFGQEVTISATVTPSTATGTVSFYDGPSLMDTQNVIGGVATTATSSFSLGSHPLTAVYSGDATTAGSTSSVHAHVVLQPTTIECASSLNASILGDSVTFTGTVTPPTATGTVTFNDDGNPIGTGTLSAGVATFTTSSLAAGLHPISAVYNGDGTYAGSASNLVSQTVREPTTISLFMSPNPSNEYQLVTLTATITPPPTAGGSSVTFKDGTTTIGLDESVVGGIATINYDFSTGGPHSLTAIYSGNSEFAGSTSAPVIQTVLAVTTTTLISAPNPSAPGQSVNLTAMVAPGSATGTVTFKEGMTVLGTVPLATGVAILNTSFQVEGPHTLTAEYGGEATHAASMSNGHVHQVESFSDLGVSLPGIYFGAAVWGDYDNDGDLDIFLCGSTGFELVSRIYKNDGGTFVDIVAGLPGLHRVALALGDYDNDGDLDLVLTGSVNSIIYRNDGGTFVDIAAGLPGVQSGAVDWGDYDNDGDLDLLLTGDPFFAGGISLILRNDNGTFVDTNAGIPGVSGLNGSSSVDWGDYDNDGDLDFLLTGYSYQLSGFISRVYRNNNGAFTDMGAGLPATVDGNAAWGDSDNDGDLDILLTGDGVSEIYRNDGGSFVDSDAGLPASSRSSASWGDCDNDGDMDVLLTGNTGSELISRIYRNEGGNFVNIGTGLPGVSLNGPAAWGDFDNDADLDFLLTGNLNGSNGISRIYRNNTITPNDAPAAPAGLSAQLVGNTATFSWYAATDAQTPAAGLTYNLRIGTTPGGNEISAAMANSINGYRRVPRLGNANHRLGWTVTLPPAAHFYWSVQAIDAAFAGSPFAAEQTLAPPQAFTDIGSAVPGVFHSSVAWGDYDNDGDLDILITGTTGSSESFSGVYRNDAGSFVDIPAGLPGVRFSSVAWGDYDNDGDLDILITGRQGSGDLSRVYRNDAGSFVDIAAGLPGVSRSSVAWGDYDNDGDLDILLTGANPSRISRVYRNDAGSFVDIAAGLQGVDNSSVAWGDYDNDGDLDILMTGYPGSGGPMSRVYRNDAGGFVDIAAGLPGVYNSSVAWGDYDNDGDLDILLSGLSSSGLLSQVYWNDAGSFVDIAAGLQEVHQSSVAWGDYDNDGDLDILMAGANGSGLGVSRVYRNDAGSFVDIAAGLLGVYSSSVAWGDYDNDGDLDFLLSGSAQGASVTSLYRNNVTTPNTIPNTPTGLLAEIGGGAVTFSWNPATDVQTPTTGLSYNLRVGTTPGGNQIFSGMADAASGYRRVPRLGNAGQRLSWPVELQSWPSSGHIYWSVQSIDGAFAGSPWALAEVSAVEDLPELPAVQALSAGTPNPFQGVTRMTFDLPRADRVTLEVFDVRGGLIRTLRDDALPAGRYEASWDGTDAEGQHVGAGVYLVRMRANGFQESRRVVLAK